MTTTKGQTMAEQQDDFREYWVGLPVGVRVHRNGHVTWTIDTSEASKAIGEEAGEEYGSAPDVTEEQALLDQAVVDAHSSTPQAETSPDTEMKCPVRYACDFRTGNLGAMAAHILDTEQTHGA
jgi:hypothetical protein